MSSWATITRPESGFRNPMMFISETDLPTPLRPENANGLSRHHAEADVIEHTIVAKGLGDILELDVGSELSLVDMFCFQSSVFSRQSFSLRSSVTGRLDSDASQ